MCAAMSSYRPRVPRRPPPHLRACQEKPGATSWRPSGKVRWRWERTLSFFCFVLCNGTPALCPAQYTRLRKKKPDGWRYSKQIWTLTTLSTRPSLRRHLRSASISPCASKSIDPAAVVSRVPPVHRFSDMTTAEFRALVKENGGYRPTHHARTRALAVDIDPEEEARMLASLPMSVDWVAAGKVTPVKRQGTHGFARGCSSILHVTHDPPKQGTYAPPVGPLRRSLLSKARWQWPRGR